MSSLVNKEYGDRISRWRDNRWNGLLGSAGYVREVYSINFVLASHLRMPFQGGQLSQYMENVGTLTRCEFNHDVYRWTVPAERLDWVREDLEFSGLVLSSTHPALKPPSR